MPNRVSENLIEPVSIFIKLCENTVRIKIKRARKEEGAFYATIR